MDDSQTNSTAYVVLVSCPDEQGLVHRITGVLFDAGFNVDEQAEYVDQINKHFFMRTEVSGKGLRAKLLESLRGVLPTSAKIQINGREKKRVVLLATQEPHCVGDLLLRNAYLELNLEVLAVIANHETLKPLAEKFELPFYCVPHQGISRKEHAQLLLKQVESHQPDYLVTAKYMRILPAEFVEHYTERIINIHHSFLPAFAGARPYHQAHERGVKIIGATAHFVTTELDQGPIIAQDIIPVSHALTPKAMMQQGRNIERTVLAEALRLVCEDRVFIFGNRTIVF